AAKVSGLEEFINKLPNNYGTYLTRYLYDGIDLSGGQWQKIALSRAFIRDSEFVILDEPTAALDPISELEIFEKFVTLSNNKTVIFISHKMVSTRLADRIIVMHQGNIHEEGTFEELISNKGLFYEMYNIQNGIYKDYQYQ
ncbi:ATP-binding cassette domain-containing protein, partial [Metabacillus halosaccharovorans]